MKSLPRALRYLKGYKWYVFFMFVTTVLPVVMELLVPRLLQLLIDQGIRAQDMAAIWRYAGIMLLTAILGSVATLGQGVCRAQISQGVAFDMRNDLFRHIHALSWRDLDELQTGQLMTRISSDVDVVRMFSSAGLALLLRALLMIIGSVVMMALLDLQLTSVIVVMLLIAFAAIGGVMRLARPKFTRVQQKLAALNTVVQENLAGVRVVKAYAREAHEIARFRAGNEDLRDENIDVGRLMSTVIPILFLLTNLGSVAVIWWGGWDTVGGRLTVGELIAFNNYLLIGMAPLLLLGNILMMVSRAEASAERVLEVLDTEPSIQPAATPHRVTATPARAGAGRPIAGHVVFDNVTFRYDGHTPAAGVAHNGSNGVGNGAVSERRRQEDVLQGVSFTVEPGQRVAVIGATGAGKSTLIHMIPRLYDVDGGAITIDGVDVRTWAPDVLRANVGLVLQQATLFRGTVRDNIAYGRPHASMEEVTAAARAAQAHDFITAMPQGYESMVEARGANLSGGQKQRLAIARAILTDPGILVLDDCTSAVDMETEFRIQEALDAEAADRTTFIVAQRISSVVNADKILVLDEGRVAAAGTHNELLERSPIYREIFASQIGKDMEDNQEREQAA